MKPSRKRVVVPGNRPRQPDPPPEIFQRSPEQKLADQARLDAEVRAMQARGVSPTLDDDAFGGAVVSGDPLAALADLRARAEAWQDERRTLPCWRAIYPAGAPEGFLDHQADSATAIRGRLACKAAPAVRVIGAGGPIETPQRDACRYAHEHPTCLWELAVGMRERAGTNLTMALGKEAADEHTLVLASLDLDAPQPLRDTDPLLVARSWVAGGRRRMTLANAGKLAPLTGAAIAAGAPVAVELDGAERLMVWGGNPGRGKTVAAIWILARRGGLYVLEYQLGRPIDVDKLAGVSGVLVVDQFQPTDPDEQRRAARRLDEIAHRRFAAGRKTLIIGNVDYLTFAARLGQIEAGRIKHPGVIAERCAQAGAFVLFGGESMRA